MKIINRFKIFLLLIFFYCILILNVKAQTSVSSSSAVSSTAAASSSGVSSSAFSSSAFSSSAPASSSVFSSSAVSSSAPVSSSVVSSSALASSSSASANPFCFVAFTSSSPYLGNSSIFAGTTITLAGSPSIINGDVDESPGTSFTGSTSATINCIHHINDVWANNAQTAYGTPSAVGSLLNLLATATPTFPALSGDLGSQATLTPGVYSTPDTAFTGTLTLSGLGQYIFKFGSSLAIATNSQITLTNGARACDVFFYVVTNVAMTGPNIFFNGNIAAQTTVATTGANVVINGSLFTNTGVTIDASGVTINTVSSRCASQPYCSAVSASSSSAPAVSSSSSSGSSISPNCFLNFNSGYPYLGNLSILAASGITNVGNSNITGDVDEYPGTLFTGFPYGSIAGQIHIDDVVAGNAMSSMTALQTALTSAAPATDLTGLALGGGRILTPGVYRYTTTAGLSGILTLNGPGQYIFQIGTGFSMTTNSQIVLTNGARACDVFWNIGTTASLTGPNIGFNGLVVAGTTVSTTGANIVVNGSLFSQTEVTFAAAVTINTAAGRCVSQPACPAISSSSTGAAARSSSSTGSAVAAGSSSSTGAVSPYPYCFLNLATTFNTSITTYFRNLSLLAFNTITNVGPSNITGDVDLYPGTSITGFPYGSISGEIHIADTVAQNAMHAFTLVQTDILAIPAGTTLDGDAGGRTLTPGVYTSSSSLGITGTLTLSGLGQYIFQIGSTLTTYGGTTILLTNGARPCDVLWYVGSSATLGGPTYFNGNILAVASISLTGAAGTVVNGTLFAYGAAITIANAASVNGPSGRCLVQPYCPSSSGSSTASSASSTAVSSSARVSSSAVSSSAAVSSSVVVSSSAVSSSAAAVSSSSSSSSTGAVNPIPFCLLNYATDFNASFSYLSNVSLIAYSTITNNGASNVTGDVDLYPGTSITGFPTGSIAGQQHIDDVVAGKTMFAYSLFLAKLVALGAGTTLTGDLGGQTITPGVYSYASSAGLTGTVTLSGLGQYVFQIGSTLTTAANSIVLLTNGTRACDVFWYVGSSATLGGGTTFNGNIAAVTSIGLTGAAGTVVNGALFASTGAVTFANAVTINSQNAVCVAVQAYCTPASSSSTSWFDGLSMANQAGFIIGMILAGILLVIGAYFVAGSALCTPGLGNYEQHVA